MGDEEREQTSNPFVASTVVTQILWFGFVTIVRNFLGSREQNSDKIHKVKTFLSGRRVVLPEECTCLLCWKRRHQTQTGSTDHRKENPGKQVGPCAVMATQSQRAIAHT